MFEIKSIFFDSPLFPLQVARTESVDNFIVIRKEEIERESRAAKSKRTINCSVIAIPPRDPITEIIKSNTEYSVRKGSKFSKISRVLRRALRFERKENSARCRKSRNETEKDTSIELLRAISLSENQRVCLLRRLTVPLTPPWSKGKVLRLVKMTRFRQ